MLTEHKTMKVTEEHAPVGGIKTTKEGFPKKTASDWVAWCAQVLAAGAVIVSIIALVVGVYQFKAQQLDSTNQAHDQPAC